MANREALRQLQSRLAERLRVARTEARPLSWLAVECAGQGLLMPLATAVRRLRDRSLPGRAACITFDGGYADNAQVALPILQRHAAPATFFVASGFLDGGYSWTDAVIELVREARTRGCHRPLILLTGQGDRETDLEAMSAGATPNETVSAMESNSAPKRDSRLVARATRPSKRSQRQAKRMNQTAII